MVNVNKKSTIYFLFLCVLGNGLENKGETQDQTSERANTLSDDADDIQKQLDNEAKDKFKFGRPKPIWIFHMPPQFPVPSYKDDFTQFPILRADEKGVTRPQPHSVKVKRINDEEVGKKQNEQSTVRNKKELANDTCFKPWSYQDQHLWSKNYKDCGGRAQSPVDLPVTGLINSHGARPLLFGNHAVMPKSMTLFYDGENLVLKGKWPRNKEPLVYGGAAHSRRYIFHSLTVHWPSEHTIGSLQYPMETQLLFKSADYKSFDEAVNGSIRDPMAFLGIINIFKYDKSNDRGLQMILSKIFDATFFNASIKPMPLMLLNPPFRQYACYYGSLPMPPCTESVLWLVRSRTLPVKRELLNSISKTFSLKTDKKSILYRLPQPLNDRKVYFFP